MTHSIGLFDSMSELSERFIKLRNAAIEQSGKPKPGVPQELADRIAELVTEFQLWSVSSPFIIPPDLYRDWQERLNVQADELAKVGKHVQKFDTTGPVEELLDTAADLAKTGIGAASFGIALVLGFWLLSQGGSKGGDR